MMHLDATCPVAVIAYEEVGIIVDVINPAGVFSNIISFRKKRSGINRKRGGEKKS